MVPVLIALGSNVGDRLAHMQSAVDLLSREISALRVSRVYGTAPMYVEDQPDFFNAAVAGLTDMGPLELLRFLKSTEAQIGRQDRPRFGPREIDIDIVAYGSLRLSSMGRLDIPHPRIPERRFVLAPIHDLDPEGLLPGLGFVKSLLAATEGQSASVCVREDAVLSVPSNR